MPNSLAGHFLVFIPMVDDPNFFRSVVLIFQHDDQGAAGVIINRRGDLPFRRVHKDFDIDSPTAELPLYFGGPVQGPVLAMHTSLSDGELVVCPGVVLSTQRENLLALVQKGVTKCRFFVNHAGWGPGQLEAEIAAGVWLVRMASADDLFEVNDELIWHRLNEEIGIEIMQGPRGFPNVPPDPYLN